VVRYARAFATGLQDAGVAPVFKHFPGHGRSSGDSHHQSVTVPPLDQLVPHDLHPFAELAGTPGAGMMLGHQQVPGLTGVDRPASLSPAAYRLLREGHGYGAQQFDGPIFTDDLSGMRAVTDAFPLPRAVAESLIAGADSPLWITTAGIGEALDAVEQALANGALSRQALDRSLMRMAALRGIPGCVGGPATGQVEGAAALSAPIPDLPARIAGATRLTGQPAPSRVVAPPVHTPEDPRRCESTRWVSTTPMASISAKTVTGPTKLNPRRLSSLASASDSGERLGTSSAVRGCGVVSGRYDQISSPSPPSDRRATTARALAMAASIFRRLRTIRSSAMSRATSSSVKAATASGENPANASRKAGRLRRIVTQLSPDWNPSRTSRSNSPASSRTGTPHSVS
jgi:hypothetical protein